MYHQMYTRIDHVPLLKFKVQKYMEVYGMAHCLWFLKWHWFPAVISRFPAVISRFPAVISWFPVVISWFPAVISIQGQV